MSLTAALIGLAGTALSAGAGIYGTHKANESAKRESELQWRRQQQAIKEQNAYNSASAQVARLQAAGLNPNMMYDNGQPAAAGTQDAHADYTPAPVQNAFGPIGAAGAEAVSSMVSIKEMENQTALAEAEVALKATLEGVNISEIFLNETTAQNMLEQLALNRMEVEQGIKESESRIEVNKANYEAKMNEAQEILQRIVESKERIKQIKADIHFTETRDIVAAALLPSQIRLTEMSAEQAYYIGQKAYEEANLVLKYYDLDLEKFELAEGKFEFEQYSFEKTMEFQADQNKRDRWLGYSNLGIQALSLVTSVASGGKGNLAGLSPSPLTRMAGKATGALWNGVSNGFRGSKQAQANYKNRKR